MPKSVSSTPFQICWTPRSIVALDGPGPSTSFSPLSSEHVSPALRQGLETVIRRLTGRDRVADLPGVAGVLEDPSRWLMRYAYDGGTQRESQRTSCQRK